MIFNQFCGGKRAAVVSIYGAPNETVTLTSDKGAEFQVNADENGYGGELEIASGTYTVYGSISGFSKTTAITKHTKTVEAWPDTATIFYWYGLSPFGGFKSAKAVPSNAYTSNPTGMQITTNENNVFLKTYGDYARGGTAYLPKTTIRGSELHLICSNVSNHGSDNARLAFVVTDSISNSYSPVATTSLTSSTTSKTLSISSISGGEYYIGITGNTSGSGTGSKQSSVRVKAIYSTGETEDVVLKTTSATVATNNTYRYGSALQATTGFAKVSSLTFGAINYVGQGTDDYNSTMIPLPGFSFSGTSRWIKLKMWVMTSNVNNRAFRWAITTSRSNESVYKGAGAVTDENQLAQGTFSTMYTSGDFSWQTFLLACDSIPADTPLYIYLWRDNDTYGNIHIMDTITATLTYAEQ